MKEQNGKLSRDEFLSFVKAVLKKKSLEENKPLYFEYRLSENGEKEKFLNRFDAFAPEGFSEYRNSVIFEFIYSRTLKAEQIKKRIKGVTDTYRKSYDATIVFILNTEFQFEDSSSAVWDLSVINNWIEEYPTEYSHACSLGMERKTVAQLCKDIWASEKTFAWQIHKSLYDAARDLDMNTELGEIARLAQRCQKDQNFRILSYNYDDFLEQYLAFLDVKCCSIFTTKVRYSNGRDSADFYGMNGQPNQSLRLYHVHGFLPKVTTRDQLDMLHMRSICLTEADYNMLYNQPYSWPIASQLSFFRENTCLFIGCSLSDPNIRRLLEITAYNPPKHYAIFAMTYKSTDALGYTTTKQLTSKDRLQIENHFYRIGINILWVKDYSEIPAWLHDLNQVIV